MLQRFLDYIDRQHLFPPGKQVLLAVSGGRDSVCLAHLCHQARLPFAVAHCNFHLRPGDCDRDQQFVARLADGYGVPFHTVDFDTRAYAAAHGQSLEEAARELRYEYFAQLLTLNSQLSPVVATAHHRDDSIETFFLNLFRGTGISGLHGIRPVSELRIKNLELKIIRPLLPFSRAEIDAYIAGNNLIERLHDTELLYKEYIVQLRSRLVKPYPSHLPGLPFEILSIDLPSLISLPSPAHSLLFELLRPYGFNGATVSDILAVVERGQIPGSNPSGQIFYSSTHVAEIHRGDLLVAPQTEPVPGRHPHPGDRVVKQPGNRSKGRLLSDYLKDLGLPRIERKHLLIGDFSHGDEPVGPVAGLTVVDKDGIRVGCLPVIAL